MHTVQQIYDQLRLTLSMIDLQIGKLKTQAEENGTQIHNMTDQFGVPSLVPLLSAKANCLSGIAALKTAELRNKK